MHIIGKTNEKNILYLINSINLIYGGAISECQNNIDRSLSDNSEWVKLLKVLQWKDILTSIAIINSTRVIVKVQSFEKFTHEFNIYKMIRENNLKGFVEYYCFFTCNGNYATK